MAREALREPLFTHPYTVYLFPCQLTSTATCVSPSRRGWPAFFPVQKQEVNGKANSQLCWWISRCRSVEWKGKEEKDRSFRKKNRLWISIWEGSNRNSSLRFTKGNRKHRAGLTEENPDVGYVHISGFCTKPTSGLYKNEDIIFTFRREQELTSSQLYSQCSLILPHALFHPNTGTYSSQSPFILRVSLASKLFVDVFGNTYFSARVTTPLVASTTTTASAATGPTCSKFSPALFPLCTEQPSPYPLPQLCFRDNTFHRVVSLRASYIPVCPEYTCSSAGCSFPTSSYPWSWSATEIIIALGHWVFALTPRAGGLDSWSQSCTTSGSLSSMMLFTSSSC